MFNHETGNLPITIMDFSGIYGEESFYKEMQFHWLDCKGISGTRGFCTPEAKAKLRELLKAYPPTGIHLIDSGNYHYVTELWLEKIERPFNLIVFDHHSDMQEPLFDAVLSCGSWILDALAQSVFLERVFLMGIGEAQAKTLPSGFGERLVCCDEKAMGELSFWDTLLKEQEKLPFYLSIDKDVLTKQEVVTDWDQGKMTYMELVAILHILIQKHEIIGIDICGECALAAGHRPEIKNDDHFNETLLKFLGAEIA